MLSEHNHVEVRLADKSSLPILAPSTSAGSTPIADELASVRHAELAAALRHDLTSYNGPLIAYGIMLAGFAYPLAMGVASLLVFLVYLLLNLGQLSISDLMELGGGLLIGFAYCVFVAVLSMLWAGIVSMLTLPFVFLVVRSLKLHGSLVSLGSFSGGLVGFIATFPALGAWMLSGGDFWTIVLLVTLGPGLTTVFGQIGGAWGGWRASQHIANYYGVVTTSNSDQATQAAFELLAEANDTNAGLSQQRWQFGLRHMMWLIVWLSLLLSVIRLIGIPFEYAIPLLVGWTMYQWTILRFGQRLIQWAGPRWTAWRSLRST